MTLQTHIPADSSGRLEGDEFFTAEEYAAIDRHRSPVLRRQLHSYTKGLTAAFIALVAALGYVLWDNERRATDQHHHDAIVQQQRREDAVAARKQIVATGNAVALLGCNRDFRTTLELRAVLKAAEAQTALDVQHGDLPARAGEHAHTFYTMQLRRLPLPDCRDVEHSVSDNPNRFVPRPKPLHP